MQHRFAQPVERFALGGALAHALDEQAISSSNSASRSSFFPSKYW